MELLSPVQMIALHALCEGYHRSHDFDAGCLEEYGVSSGGSGYPTAKIVARIVRMKMVSNQYLQKLESGLLDVFCGATCSFMSL